jgi:Ca-activated chloride channel family protein
VLARTGVVTLLFLCAGLRAQEGSARFTGAANLVVLHLAVTDSRGVYVTGLAKDAFVVREDGQPQQISFFTPDDIPVTAGLLFDNSSSMTMLREIAVAGGAAYVGASRTGDEIFGLTFTEVVRPVLPPASPFTNDPDVMRAALEAALTARGRTALFDAIMVGIEHSARGRPRRKVLVLTSDGGDNASTATQAEVIARTQASNVTIYTVTLIDPVARDGNPRLLKELARSTGGQSFRPRGETETADAFRRIAEDVHHAYTVGYVPVRPPDGTFRRLQVGVNAPRGQRLEVRTRTGYLAAASQHPESRRGR